MQKLKDEISEKKLQMHVLEQRMIGSVEMTPHTSAIELSQVIMWHVIYVGSVVETDANEYETTYLKKGRRFCSVFVLKIYLGVGCLYLIFIDWSRSC